MRQWRSTKRIVRNNWVLTAGVAHDLRSCASSPLVGCLTLTSTGLKGTIAVTLAIDVLFASRYKMQLTILGEEVLHVTKQCPIIRPVPGLDFGDSSFIFPLTGTSHGLQAYLPCSGSSLVVGSYTDQSITSLGQSECDSGGFDQCQQNVAFVNLLAMSSSALAVPSESVGKSGFVTKALHCQHILMIEKPLCAPFTHNQHDYKIP